MKATGCRLFSERYFPAEEVERHALRQTFANEVDDPVNDGTSAHVPEQICLSSPDSEWRAIQQLYFMMINSARRQVLLTSPFFILDEMIAEALKTAALSGVDVRVMISARGPDRYVAYWAANTFAADVVRAGAKVLLYQGGYLHAKTICVDGELAVVGSANWDIRSFSINYEIAALLYDEHLAASILDAFMRDDRDCTEFDLYAYNKRSRLSRFRDSAARLMSPLL